MWPTQLKMGRTQKKLTKRIGFFFVASYSKPQLVDQIRGRGKGFDYSQIRALPIFLLPMTIGSAGSSVVGNMFFLKILMGLVVDDWLDLRMSLSLLIVLLLRSILLAGHALWSYSFLLLLFLFVVICGAMMVLESAHMKDRLLRVVLLIWVQKYHCLCVDLVSSTRFWC